MAGLMSGSGNPLQSALYNAWNITAIEKISGDYTNK